MTGGALRMTGGALRMTEGGKDRGGSSPDENAVDEYDVAVGLSV